MSATQSKSSTPEHFPAIITYLGNQIFESLPKEKANAWREAFSSAIRPGCDLSKVWLQCAAWLLDHPSEGVIRFVDKKDLGEDGSKVVGDAFREMAQLLREGNISAARWRKVAALARWVKAEASAAKKAPRWAMVAEIVAMWAAAEAAAYVSTAPRWAVAPCLRAAEMEAADCLWSESGDFADACVRRSEKLLEFLRTA